MKTSTALIVTAAAILLGAGGSFLFVHLADSARRDARAERLRIPGLNDRISQLQDAYSRDSLDANFTTPDLCFHELHGRVRDVRNGEESMSFDRNGVWTNPKAYISRGGNNLSFERNKFDYIIAAVTPESMEGQPIETVEYEWSGRRVKRIKSHGLNGDYTVTLTYDNHDLLTSSHTVSSDETARSEIATTYTYQDFDSHGNWVRRTARSAIKTTVFGGYYDEETGEMVGGDEPVLDSSEQTEQRTITYYS